MRKRKNKKAASRSRDESRAPASGRRNRRTPSRWDFNPDYSYIKKDLRRIALLTAFFLVLLIALAFMLPT